ncbi:uncharacterized protein TRIREDRAFT_105167, partial [Trichoderma reesei QM6a]
MSTHDIGGKISREAESCREHAWLATEAQQPDETGILGDWLGDAHAENSDNLHLVCQFTPTAAYMDVFLKTATTRGNTKIDTNLAFNLLRPWVYDAIASGVVWRMRFEGAQLSSTARVNDRNSVVYQVGQVGDDSPANDFFQLRGLRGDSEINGLVWCMAVTRVTYATSKMVANNWFATLPTLSKCRHCLGDQDSEAYQLR